MNRYGKTIIIVYAVLMLGGGIGGYAAKHSIPSLLSGVISAILLIVGYSMTASKSKSKPKTGYGLSLFVAMALTVVFIERAVKTSAEASSLGRNIGLAVLSLIVAAVFGKCMQESPA